MTDNLIVQGNFGKNTPGLLQCTKNGSLKSINQTLATMLGFDSPNLITATDNLTNYFVNPDEARRFLESIISSPCRSESEWLRKDGQRLSVRLYACVAGSYSNANQHILIFVENITESKWKQQESEIQGRIDSFNRFTSVITHDLGNILNYILGYTELLREPGISEADRDEYLNLLITAVQKGSASIQRYRNLRYLPYCDPVEIDLSQSVLQMEPAIANTLGKDRNLHLQLSQDRLLILINPNVLEQIMIILAENSRDAMKPGGTLTVKTNLLANPSEGSMVGDESTVLHMAELLVADTGSGIPEEIQNQIFDPFFTTKGNCREGLGLFLAFRHVQQIGGSIRVNSTTGEGTLVRIILPIITSEISLQAQSSNSL